MKTFTNYRNRLYLVDQDSLECKDESWNGDQRKWTIELIIFLVCLLISLVAGAQAIDGNYIDRQNIINGQNTLGNNNPAIAMADNGSYVVVHHGRESSASSNSLDILGGVYTLSSGWTDLGVINNSVSGIQDDPQVAVSADGSTFAVVWESDHTGDDNIYLSVYGSVDGPGYTGTADILVNTSTVGDQINPEIAMDDNGDFVVVWFDWNDDNIYGQRFNSSGIKQGANFVVDAQLNTNFVLIPLPRVGMAGDGSFVVAWEDNRSVDPSGGIFAKRYTASGTALGGTFLVNSTTNNYQGGLKLAVSKNGNFLVSYSTSGDDYYQKYNANGTTAGDEVLLSTSFTNPVIRSIVIDDNNNYILAITDNGDDVYSFSYDWSDNLIGNERVLTSYNNIGTAEIAIERDQTTYLSLVYAYNSFADNYGIISQIHDLCVKNPGPISGVTDVCAGQSNVNYSLTPVEGAFTYTWTLDDVTLATFSNGLTEITTTGTSANNVTVNFDAVNTGSVQLSVVANGLASCGSSTASSSISIDSDIVGNPGSISGLTTVVENNYAVYSISPVSGAVSYNWTLPPGASIDTDNGNSITALMGTTSGSVSVTATDACGNVSSSSTKAVTIVAVDNDPPQIVRTTPANGEEGVPVDQVNYSIFFNESVTIAGGGSIFLTAGKSTIGTATNVTLLKGGSGAAITFSTSTDMVRGLNYFVSIPSGYFEDGQNNGFAGTNATNWSFKANRLPTAINLSSTDVNEGTTSGTVIATLSAVDSDAGDSFTYSLVSGAGSTDNGDFSINGNQLVINTVPDYESQTSYSIRIRVTDDAGDVYDS
jgi:hypothetical protein